MSAALQGRVALVTGASSGIGEGVALALASAGAAVAVAARRRDRLEDLAGRIRDAGGTALTVELDVTDPASVDAAVERTRADLGGLDVLVANAGIGAFGTILEGDPGAWRTAIETDLLGVMHVVRSALPGLLDDVPSAPGGVRDVVVISSLASRRTPVGTGVYSAAKHGVNAFCVALRAETVDSGLRVTVVEPGLVRTEATGDLLDGDDGPGFEVLRASDVGDLVAHAVALPARVSLNEVLIRPTREP